jgi:hypothetical protein
MTASNKLYKVDTAYKSYAVYKTYQVVKECKRKRIGNKNMIEFKYNSSKINIAS